MLRGLTEVKGNCVVREVVSTQGEVLENKGRLFQPKLAPYVPEGEQHSKETKH